MNIITRMAEREGFTDTGCQIIDYIMYHDTELAQMTIGQLAKQTYTSNPTIIRLCRKLGMDGFREFKVRFAGDLEKYRQSKNDVDMDYPFRGNERPGDIMKNIGRLTKNTIDILYKDLDIDALTQAANIIGRSNRIYFCANGGGQNGYPGPPDQPGLQNRLHDCQYDILRPHLRPEGCGCGLQ